MDKARPCRPSYPFVTITDNESLTPRDDSSAAVTVTNIENAHSTLRFHMDNSVWDVIQKEVMDWRDSSWTSMNLPANKTCENIGQPHPVDATNAMLILVRSLDPIPPFLECPGTDRTGER